MPIMWIEHMTFRSSVWRSPNWAIWASFLYIYNVLFLNILYILFHFFKSLTTIDLSNAYHRFIIIFMDWWIWWMTPELLIIMCLDRYICIRYGQQTDMTDAYVFVMVTRWIWHIPMYSLWWRGGYGLYLCIRYGEEVDRTDTYVFVMVGMWCLGLDV